MGRFCTRSNRGEEGPFFFGTSLDANGSSTYHDGEDSHSAFPNLPLTIGTRLSFVKCHQFSAPLWYDRYRLMGGFSFFSQLLKIHVIDRSPHQSQIRRRHNSSFNFQVRVSKGSSRINGLAYFQLHTLGPETDNDNSKRVKVIQDGDDWYLIWEAIACWYQKIPFNNKYYYEYGANGGRFNTTQNIKHDRENT